jgi:hypothetical protein
MPSLTALAVGGERGPVPHEERRTLMDIYHVVWEIDVEADSPQEAAEEALALGWDPDSTAKYFHVTAPDGTVTEIDLYEWTE